jgi:hypothetical protein
MSGRKISAVGNEAAQQSPCGEAPAISVAKFLLLAVITPKAPGFVRK